VLRIFSSMILIHDFREMCIIDEKQEAIARIRMAIDNNKKARLDLESTEDIIESEVKVDPESKSSKTWRMGSQEGKKMNFCIMVADLAKADPRYHNLDKRLRDFIACNLPEEAVQMKFEDDINVSLDFSNINFGLWRRRNDVSHRYKDINVLSSSTSQWKIGLKERTS
jgi:hypothetical protein